jgi:methyl-accepting chemotaxis protein
MHDSNIAGLEAVAEMQTAIGGVRQASRDALIAPTPELTQEALATLQERLAAFRTAVDHYGASQPSAEKAALVASAAAKFDEYEVVIKPGSGSAGRRQRRVRLVHANQAQAAPLAGEAQASLEEVHNLEVAEANVAAGEARESYESQRTQAIVILVVGITVAVSLGIVVARGMARDVGRVKDVAKALASGDLTRTSGLTTRDELGQMGIALDAAVQEMRGVLAAVASSADAVAASSEELSASSAQISASAEETMRPVRGGGRCGGGGLRNVQTVAAGAEQMGASIREIATNAAEASAVAARAVTAAETTTADVAKLGGVLGEIGNVVKVIT